MKKYYLVLIGLLVLTIIVVILRGNEDAWIKTNNGIWEKHGNPSETPASVLEQQEAISKALELYTQKKSEGINFSSQCLGTVGNYAVDIAHVPRISEDNLVINQCEAYTMFRVSHFIEMDKDGNILRIN